MKKYEFLTLWIGICTLIAFIGFTLSHFAVPSGICFLANFVLYLTNCLMLYIDNLLDELDYMFRSDK
jgi:hypothetical protein